jgi:hypothetical protein
MGCNEVETFLLTFSIGVNTGVIGYGIQGVKVGESSASSRFVVSIAKGNSEEKRLNVSRINRFTFC